MTNSQAAAHESWLVRGSPRAPGFSCEQSASIPLILQEPADFTCTQPRDPPPHRFYMPISWQRKNIFGTSGESNQVFCGGSSTSQPPCYILRVCYKFHRFFDATPPQSRNNLGYTLLSSHCTRHFSLPHHAPIFSRIHPLSGQGRHFWQIGSYPWKLTCEMLPCPPGFSHEQCTWYF